MKSVALDELQRPTKAGVLRLLVLGSAQEAAKKLGAELSAVGFGAEATVAWDKEGCFESLRNGSYDAIVAENRLANGNAIEVLKELRAGGRDMPFLLVVDTLDENAAVEYLRHGVTNFVERDHLRRVLGALKRSPEGKRTRDEASRGSGESAGSDGDARAQLAELEQIYRTAPIGLAVYGPDLRYLRVNEQLARINGLPADQHPGLMTRDVNPDMARAVEPYLRRCFAKGESIRNVEIQGTTQGPTGFERSWLVSFHPLRGASGVIFAISVVVLETTERKQAEEALALSEARNRQIVENSVYGIFRISPDGTFLDPNPAMLRILGCQLPEELNPPVLVRDVFRFPSQYAECLAACRSEQQIHSAEMEWKRRDGGMVTVLLHLRGLPAEESGALVEVIAEDVTEVRAMERQLHQAQKFEAIGQLAGGVAHDFNNVVGAILGWAELGLDQSRSHPQIAERFTRIREQAERAAALTRELLAFARRQVLQPRIVDLNMITSNLVSFLDRVLRKDIELKVVNASLETIKADATQIEQVLMNLCLNARDAMPAGGRLLIETEMVDIDESYCRFYPYVTAGRYAVLSVSDTGVGMDAEVRERIFEPFFTTKEPGKNSGMGLATAYGIVKQHGGFIHVYSETGHGSLFRVYLPVVASAHANGSETPSRATPGAEARGTETLLLAEDHDSIREMARQTLVNLGYRVLSAADGEEALTLCEDEVPDLAILDLVMPKLGGPETATKLIERFKNLPILFTSGYSQESKGFESVTPARYLQKPYSPSNLSRIVREILDHAKSAAPAS